MDEKFIFETAISYGDVDRAEKLTLAGVFKLFQEAAIRHANRFETGTRAVTERGESWVLNRIAASLSAYPNYGDKVRVETWSRGIDGFRGFREYRLFLGDTQLAEATSLWLYVKVASKALIRVPAEIAQTFPRLASEPAFPDIDKLRIETPARTDHNRAFVTVRYADVDALGHVNNTAYLDYLQTALARAALPPRPQTVRLRFVKEIPGDAESIAVTWERRGATDLFFSVGPDDHICAQGEIAWTAP